MNLNELPRTRPPGYWAVNFTDAELRRALDPEPTEQDELLRTELARRAKLPVVANPRLVDLPVLALGWWAAHFETRVDAAQTFDEVYPASRAWTDVIEATAEREWGREMDTETRLFDAWQS